MYQAYQSAPDNVFGNELLDNWGWEMENNYFAIGGNPEYKSYPCEYYDMVMSFFAKERGVDDLLTPRKSQFTEDEKKRLLEAQYGGAFFRTVCDVLSIMSGDKWDYKVIRGVTQSEWNVAYFDTDILNDVSDAERRYFYLGTEWRIEDKDGFAYWHYSTADNYIQIREELADILMCKPEEIKLFAFEGYRREPMYEEV